MENNDFEKRFRGFEENHTNIVNIFTEGWKGVCVGWADGGVSGFDKRDEALANNGRATEKHLSSMLVFDAEDGVWSNQTTVLETNESGTLNILEGVGKEGLLVFIGGASGGETQWVCI